MRIAGPEPRRCPPEFQARVTRMFGINQFGEPNYKFAWNQSTFHIRGTLWRDQFGNERLAYRKRYMGDGTPCWMLMRWKPAAFYGTPEYFYDQTRDPETGLCHMGEYPWRGRYEILYQLRTTEMVKGKLEVSNFPLSHILIDAILPLLQQAQMMTQIERDAAKELARKHEQDQLTEEIAERMADSMPKWFGPVSFSGQGCRTPVLNKMMDKIERQWKIFAKIGKPAFQKGFFQGNRPRVAAR